MFTQSAEETRSFPPDLKGDSAGMTRLRELVAKFAGARAPVLITGESGSGKDRVARALHAQGARRDGPFVTLACGAFPDTLVEDELFGKRFEAAERGTLVLDDVGALPAAAQARLVRILEAPASDPLSKLDVRIVSTTTRPLTDQIALGRFREDLYYQLKTLEIAVPPLRDRGGDVGALVAHFLKELDVPGAPDRISEDAVKALSAHAYPGNVRELENAVRHAMVAAAGTSEIRIDHLPPELSDPNRAGVANLRPLHEAVAEFEKAYLQKALALFDGRRSATAEKLGISRKNLWEKLRKHGLQD